MKVKKPLLVQPEGEMWKQIRVELNEDAKTKDKDLAIIREWLKQQPHLPHEFEDKALLSFLRGCSFSLEKTKRKLDMYFTMRAACPEFFDNRDPTSAEIQGLLQKAQGPVLSGITPNGRRVTVVRGTSPEMDSRQVSIAMKILLMVGDIRMFEEKEGVAGDIFLMDAAILGPSLLARISPTMMKKFLTCVQEAYPVKLKEVHIINTSPIVEGFVNILKPFLKEKIRKRIYIHREIKDVYKYIPQEMLPVDYGGKEKSMDELHENWIQALIEYRDWFLQQESLKANESLRPGRPTNYDELFGIDGSFRQLAID